MTLSNTKNGYIGGIGEIWRGTDGGSFHVMAPSTDAYEICFDGRCLIHKRCMKDN